MSRRRLCQTTLIHDGGLFDVLFVYYSLRGGPFDVLLWTQTADACKLNDLVLEANLLSFYGNWAINVHDHPFNRRLTKYGGKEIELISEAINIVLELNWACRKK